MLIKNARHAAAVLALVIFAIPAAQAQTASQGVEYSVVSIQKIALSGLAPTLDIITAAAGTAKTSITNSAATYAIWNNVAGMKITAGLLADMPTDLTLSATLAAPAGATSAGITALALTGGAKDVVTGINKLSASLLGITYTLDALPTAGVVGSASATVTYTVTAGT